ncbi:MAG: NTP transferase domain-containing protein [Prevotella sp.]|nr:NTP transferase domain-containing protein [Prevotella sp.]
MRYAIIAAGEGSRLAQEGIDAPKPLVKVNDEHLIDRLLRIFMENDAEEIVVICNDLTPYVSSHLARIQNEGLYGRPIPLRFIVKSTPSSMHSFFELSKTFDVLSPFVLTTVDTIFREEEFGNYISAFKQVLAEGGDGMMGVTDYIDDEKPLYVETVGQGSSEWPRITNFLDACDHPHYISGGIYGLTPRTIETLNACIERGESRMRNFQRALIRDGLQLRAYCFSKVLDIDHASDIQKAEEFLKGGR